MSFLLLLVVLKINLLKILFKRQKYANGSNNMRNKRCSFVCFFLLFNLNDFLQKCLNVSISNGILDFACCAPKQDTIVSYILMCVFFFSITISITMFSQLLHFIFWYRTVLMSVSVPWKQTDTFVQKLSRKERKKKNGLHHKDSVSFRYVIFDSFLPKKNYIFVRFVLCGLLQYLL